MNILDFDRYVYRCVVFKLTNHCNLACDYCYRGSNHVYKKDIMPLDIIDKIIESLVELNSNSKSEVPLYLLWHGGEPLLAGMAYFEKILELERMYTDRYAVKFYNGVQTNAVSINKKWAEFLKNRSITVGISIDGHKAAHDEHRRSKSGRSSFGMTMRGLKSLQDAGVETNAIAVINNETSGMVDEIYEFFGENKFRMVDFIPCFDYGEQMTLQSDKYSKFMKRIIERYFGERRPDLKVRLLDDIALLIAGKVSKNTPLSCEVAGRCGEIISVLTSGDVYPCECLNCLGDMCMGNIKEETISEMVGGEKYARFRNIVRKVSRECTNCDVFRICRGGCFNRRVMQKDAADPIDHFCAARKDIIKSIADRMNKRS